MENTYSSLIKNRVQINSNAMSSQMNSMSFNSLKELVEDSQEHSLKLYTEEEVIYAFVGDLKKVLEKEDLEELLQEFFGVENNLIQLDSLLGEKVKVPKLDEFYKNLSPGLLRSMWEYCLNPDSPELILHSWIESMRVAIEEEFYFWQEKTLL